MFSRNSALGLLLLTFGLLMGMRFYVDHKLKQTSVDQEPLNFDASFIANHTEMQGTKTSVVVPYGELIFSDKGAILTDMIYQREIDHVLQEFTILSEANTHEMSERAFLVVLDGVTPLSYELKQVVEHEQNHTLEYVTIGQPTIIKEFTIWKDRPQVDLKVTVRPDTPTKVRLFWPSPALVGLGEDDIVDGFVLNQKDSFTKVAQNKIAYTAYSQPTMFGVEDKYFIFSMVGDTKHFAERAYFKNEDKRVLAILESKKIESETTWTTSFYCGPKQSSTMLLVDKRLEKAFDHGIFGFITKPLLKLLSLLNGLVHNYGLAILIVTFLIKLVTLPFTWTGASKMRRLEEYQRKMDYLGKKFKDNKPAYEAARVELLQKEGFAPLASCLPLFVPIPFFIALQSGLSNSLELYRAPFFLWITDLSAADPYKVLPFLLALLFLGSGLMSNKTGRQNITTVIMAAVMFGVTSYASAGICLFIIANIGLHFLQTAVQKAIGA